MLDLNNSATPPLENEIAPMICTALQSLRLALLLSLAIPVQAQEAAPATQTLVQQGQYLARAGDCTSCHTAQNGQPYAGGFRLEIGRAHV